MTVILLLSVAAVVVTFAWGWSLRRRSRHPGSLGRVLRPQGVRIEHADGSCTPIELADGGVIDGIHVWLMDRRTVLRPGDVFRADLIPPQTKIGIPS